MSQLRPGVAGTSTNVASTQPVFTGKETPLRRMQNNFNTRVDSEIGRMIESFGSIIRAAKLNTKASNDKVESAKDRRDNLQINILIENLILSAESLSQLVYELKQIYVLNDTSTIHAELQANTDALQQRKAETDQRIEKFSKELDEALLELETEHYSSLQNAFSMGTHRIYSCLLYTSPSPRD
eukprot:TRINITY_DN2930_c0_g1_i1.p1 TRINITY_DN2930_c0_g1~~TRINITY_DN2930_c0_g1_i1.p1  ORF type:complete len:183 (-),score=30.85 TRINITY_DN2930_c0_g1_i1:16-564(-)